LGNIHRSMADRQGIQQKGADMKAIIYTKWAI
jgi:hypothetical protein